MRGLFSDRDDGFASMGQVAGWWGIPAENFVVSDTVRNTNPEGGTVALGDAYSDNVAVYHKPPGGRGPTWIAMIVPMMARLRRIVRRWVENNPHATVVEGKMYYQVRLTSKEAAYRINDVL